MTDADDERLRAHLERIAPDVDVVAGRARVGSLAAGRRRRRAQRVAVVGVAAALLLVAGGVALRERPAATSGLQTVDGPRPPTPPTTIEPDSTTTAPASTVPAVAEPTGPSTTVVTGSVQVALVPMSGRPLVTAGTSADIQAVITNGMSVPITFGTLCGEDSVRTEDNPSGVATPSTEAPATETPSAEASSVEPGAASPSVWSGEEGTLAAYLAPDVLAEHNRPAGTADLVPAGLKEPATKDACAADRTPTLQTLAPGARFTSRFVFDARVDPLAVGTPITRTFRTTFWYTTNPDGTGIVPVDSAPLVMTVTDVPGALPDPAWLDAVDHLPEVRDLVASLPTDDASVTAPAIAVSLSYWDGAWELRFLTADTLLVRLSPTTGEVLGVDHGG